MRRPGGGVVALGFALAAATAAVLTAAPAAAQEPGDTAAADTVPGRPFVEGGVYDRPFLGRLLGRTAVGGYAEAHARWERVDGLTEEAGFVARRANLFTSTRVSDRVRMALEIEIEEGGEELLLEYAAIDVTFAPAATLRAGMILVPLGRFNLAHDSPMNEFTDRPLVSTELLGVALSEPGFGFLGWLPAGGEGRLTYEVYAVNGFHAGVVEDDPGGTRVPAGRRNVEDANASPAFTGRVAWSPSVGREIGLSAHHGAWNTFRSDGLDVEERRDLTLAALDLEVTAGGFRIEGEGALVRVELPSGLDGLFQSRQRGFYVQAVRPFGHGLIETMPGAWLEAGVRLDAVDFDAERRGDSVKQLSVGLQLQLGADTVLKLDWVRGAAFDAFNNRSDHAGVLLSLATYF